MMSCKRIDGIYLEEAVRGHLKTIFKCPFGSKEHVGIYNLQSSNTRVEGPKVKQNTTNKLMGSWDFSPRNIIVNRPARLTHKNAVRSSADATSMYTLYHSLWDIPGGCVAAVAMIRSTPIFSTLRRLQNNEEISRTMSISEALKAGHCLHRRSSISVD